MRRTLCAAALALGVLWINLAAAETDVSKVWNTSESAYAYASDFTDVWSPIEITLFANTVFDESNRYQYTDVGIVRQGWGAVNRTGEGYIYFYRTMSCRIYDRGVLKVSEAGADLAATTLDPTSPDCSTSGYRIDCDASGECAFNWEYGYGASRIVQGHWAQPELTRSATSTVQEVNYFPLRRSNQVCKMFEGRGFSGFFSFGGTTWDQRGDSSIYRTHCQATQQANP